MWDPEVALLLTHARDGSPFRLDGACWRVVSSKIAMDFESMENYRKFVLERLADGECSKVDVADALASAE
jgi:hypothetical protein